MNASLSWWKVVRYVEVGTHFLSVQKVQDVTSLGVSFLRRQRRNDLYGTLFNTRGTRERFAKIYLN